MADDIVKDARGFALTGWKVHGDTEGRRLIERLADEIERLRTREEPTAEAVRVLREYADTLDQEGAYNHFAHVSRLARSFIPTPEPAEGNRSNPHESRVSSQGSGISQTPQEGAGAAVSPLTANEDNTLEIAVVESVDVPGLWSVEAVEVSRKDDGCIHQAMFQGPAAEARAREYHAFKYGRATIPTPEEGKWTPAPDDEDDHGWEATLDTPAQPSADAAGDWVMVPRVATTEMIVAATEEWLCIAAQEDRAETIWDAMIAAAPAPAWTDEHELIDACGRQFRDYERQHRAKGTPEADAKAEVNREFAERCEAALAALDKEKRG